LVEWPVKHECAAKITGRSNEDRLEFPWPGCVCAREENRE
jgi:hypothetical protein